MKKLFVLFFIPILLFTSCSIFEKKSFAGDWEFNLKGDYSDKITFNVNDLRAFTYTKNINVGGNDFDATFNGQITEDGTVNCAIIVQGMKVAELKGTLNYETGSGTWSGAGYSGTWSAVKK